MTKSLARLAAVLMAGALAGVGVSGSAFAQMTSDGAQVAAPVLITANAQNGALIIHLSAGKDAVIRYTLDGSAPTAASQVYYAPFLISSHVTLKAVAEKSGNLSGVTMQVFAPNIAPGTLIWSDEFNNSSGANAGPDAAHWTFDTGKGKFGNHELEHYCVWGEKTAPCSAASPSVYVGTDNVLHIVAQRPSTGVYTSGRIKTQGLLSFQYGRVEARMKLPETQGMWPAFWTLGNNITKVKWPACGELDIMEHVDGSNPLSEGYDWIQGTIHGTDLDGGMQYHPSGFSAADWHTYGMIWTKGKVQFYVDDPSKVYATFTPDGQTGKWPFDDGPQFIILNLAVGGDWPGPPDATTLFPAQMQVDYVRLYKN